MNTTRREMIRTTACFTAAAALVSHIAPLWAAPESRAFKIGACEWNLGKLSPATLDTAREIGLDGVQVTMGGVSTGLNMRQASVRDTYLEASRRTGVALASLALAETNEVPLFNDPRGAVWLLDSIEVCRALNLRVILVAMFGRGELRAEDKPAVDNVVNLLREIAPRAEKAGVILGLENYCSAETNLDIIQRVGSQAVQVYYDVGNSTDKGYDIYREIRLLGKNICEFHAKDAGHMLGQGRIDFAKVRAAMDAIEYRGWIQIEAAAPHGLVTDYKAHLAFLRQNFPSA